MTWPHPPRGTCVPECPEYGRCHCGCGRATKKSERAWAAADIVRHRHRAFVHGHAPGSQATMIRNRGPHGCYSNTGIPVERLVPLVNWLHERYGSWRRAAEVVGMNADTFYGLRSRMHVSPTNAGKITAAVLAHRRSADPFADKEPIRYVAPPSSGCKRTEVQRITRGVSGRPPAHDWMHDFSIVGRDRRAAGGGPDD